MHLRYVWTLAVILLAGCTTDIPPEPFTAITNVTVLDASQQTENATVLFSGDTITAVGTRVTVPADATVIDGSGKFLIPGLWDAHVHLSYYPDLGIDHSYPLFIANGITAVRDTGGLTDIVMPLREAARVPGAVAPRVYVAGPLVDGAQRVYAGLNGRPNISVGVGTPDEARAQIDALHAAGVDLIKLYEMQSPEAFTAAAQRANELGLPITSHVPLSMDAVDAARAGIDGIEHMRNLEQSCAADHQARLAARRQALADGKDKDGGDLRTELHAAYRADAIELEDAERCTKVIAALAREEVFQTPTLTVNTFTSTPLAARADWPDTFVYLPSNVREDWTAGAARFAERMASGSPSPAGQAFRDWSFAMVAKLRDGGVNIMAGTDNPIGFLTPGFSLHEELAFLVEAGLTPMDAITAATLHPAEFMRIDDKVGTIERSKWADLVLLDADPRQDIRNTQRINSVIKGGRVFGRAELDGLLAELKLRSGGVLVLGGAGQLGSEIVKDLLAAGEHVSVLVRPTSNRSRLDGLDVTYVIGDMLMEADMKRVFNSANYRVVVDASGITGMAGDQSFYPDSQKLISKHAKDTGVSQIILHGAIGAGDSAEMFRPENLPPFQRVSIAAKSEAEEILAGSGVPYTIIRHMTLLPMETQESGNAKLTEDHTAIGAVTRDGLARLTMECLDAPKCMNETFHAVDLDADLTGRYTAMWDRYEQVLKPEYYRRP